MTRLNTQLIQLLLLVAGLVLATDSAAQDPRWFRVELLIFANQSAAAEKSEAWEPTPVLAYPDQRRFLINPKTVADNAAQYHASSVVDDYGFQTLTVEPAPAQDPGEVAAEPQIEPSQIEPGSTLESEQSIAPSSPTPFTVLPRSELEFLGKAAYMQRTGRYQILFHQAWLQPFADEAHAIPIVVDRSGDLQNWPRLQGAVKLYLSRYLHIETNLWLNTDGRYLPQDWQMPPPPLGPPSLSIIYPPESETLDLNEPLPAEEEMLEVEPVGPISPWRHAVLLQQKRRMRSTEVHYIDHPMLGVVVKISPVSDQELLQRAGEEGTE